jgi:endonuclease/exonuclease/phosphatase family metal-dependent hydrolase
MLYRRISKAFKQQQQQAEIFKSTKVSANIPSLFADMNNSAYSYVYRNVKGKLKDCFERGRHWFGQTYKFKYYPARIDYIFVDEKMIVKENFF